MVATKSYNFLSLRSQCRALPQANWKKQSFHHQSYYLIILSLFAIVFLFNACSNNEAATRAFVEIPSVTKYVDDPGFKLENGVLFYEGAPFSGYYREMYPNGQVRMEIQYYNGKENGYYRGWYADGTKWFERYYTDGWKSGVHTGWWENGQVKFVYHFNDIGEYEGNVKEWSPDGLLIRDFNYHKGREEGSQKAWQNSGKIKANYEVVNGERFGLIGLKKCSTVKIDSTQVTQHAGS